MDDLEISTQKSVLKRFGVALHAAYGKRLDRVVLYGSRARGDARPDSDFDIAVFLRKMDSFGVEAEKISSISIDVLETTAAVVNAFPFNRDAYEQRTAFMVTVRREGVTL